MMITVLVSGDLVQEDSQSAVMATTESEILSELTKLHVRAANLGKKKLLSML